MVIPFRIVSGSAKDCSMGISKFWWIIPHICIGVPALWVRIYCSGVAGVGHHETTYAGGVGSRAVIVEAAFAVAFFPGELVVLRNIISASSDDSAVGIIIKV